MTAFPCNTTPRLISPATSPTTSQVRPARRSVPQEHSTEKCVGTRLGRQCWLLPALSMRQRVLLLTCDEGGAPHRAAVAVPEPAHRGWRWVRGAAEAMVWLSLCSERRGWAPHHHSDRKLVSECALIGGTVCFVFPKGTKVDKVSTVLFSETYWGTPFGKRFGPKEQPVCVCVCCKRPVDNFLLQIGRISSCKGTLRALE